MHTIELENVFVWTRVFKHFQDHRALCRIGSWSVNYFQKLHSVDFMYGWDWTVHERKEIGLAGDKMVGTSKRVTAMHELTILLLLQVSSHPGRDRRRNPVGRPESDPREFNPDVFFWRVRLKPNGIPHPGIYSRSTSSRGGKKTRVLSRGRNPQSVALVPTFLSRSERAGGAAAAADGQRRRNHSSLLPPSSLLPLQIFHPPVSLSNPAGSIRLGRSWGFSSSRLFRSGEVIKLWWSIWLDLDSRILALLFHIWLRNGGVIPVCEFLLRVRSYSTLCGKSCLGTPNFLRILDLCLYGCSCSSVPVILWLLDVPMGRSCSIMAFSRFYWRIVLSIWCIFCLKYAFIESSFNCHWKLIQSCYGVFCNVWCVLHIFQQFS
jgi:hypothetical protein